VYCSWGYCDDLAASQLPVHVSYLTGRSTDLAQPIPRGCVLTGSPNQMTMSLSVLQLDGTDAAEVEHIPSNLIGTAVLRKDVDTQATVMTLLLRNYLSTSHISQADLLISHNPFPVAASNNQIARYMFCARSVDLPVRYETWTGSCEAARSSQ
jgi:hypothetical protein